VGGAYANEVEGGGAYVRKASDWSVL